MWSSHAVAALARQTNQLVSSWKLLGNGLGVGDVPVTGVGGMVTVFSAK